MRLFQKTKLFPLLALTVAVSKKRTKACAFTATTLMLIISAFLFVGTATVFAADIPPTVETETLTVDEVWLTGDTLHIAVTDKDSGESQTLEMNLSDYAKSSDEFVTVQATDSSGRTSNAIQFKNPYYVPQEENTPEGGNGEANATVAETEPSQSAISEGAKPFTPDGTGGVADNVTENDGKEFFSITTEDGNVFYLIVDRQRTSENVYLLNAVTENDLASLAKPGDGKSESAIAEPAPTAAQTPEQPSATPETMPEPPVEKSGGNNNIIIFAVVAVVAVGGAGYYFKIVRPKKYAVDDSDNYDDADGELDADDELDEDDEMEYGDDESEVSDE
jgi:hypothetical protein